MAISNLFIMLGGLAVFLFGMNVMGNALERQADSRLRNILTHLTENPLLGFLWGLSTTAALQSSSAATVIEGRCIYLSAMYNDTSQKAVVALCNQVMASVRPL